MFPEGTFSELGLGGLWILTFVVVAVIIGLLLVIPLGVLSHNQAQAEIGGLTTAFTPLPGQTTVSGPWVFSLLTIAISFFPLVSVFHHLQWWRDWWKDERKSGKKVVKLTPLFFLIILECAVLAAYSFLRLGLTTKGVIAWAVYIAIAAFLYMVDDDMWTNLIIERQG